MAEVRARPAYANRNMRGAKPFTAEQIARLRRLVDQYGLQTAAEIAGTSTNAICRVRARGWTVGAIGPQRKPRPTDFVLQADDMSLLDLSRHYGVSVATVSRWAAEVGRKPKQGHRTPSFVLPANAPALVKRHGMKAAAGLCGCHPETLRKHLRIAAALNDRSAGWAERRIAA